MTKQKQKQTPPSKPEQKDVPERRLRDREELFCREVVLGKTLHEAYANAGYKANNKVTAASLACRLLRNDRIKARVDTLRAEAAERYRLTVNNVLRQTGAILNADMRNYATWGPTGVTLKPSSELTDEEAMAVSEVSETVTKDGGTVKFKLHQKSHSQDLGAKILKMVTENLFLIKPHVSLEDD